MINTSDQSENTILTENVPETAAGMRLDQVLAELFPDYSRSKLQTWIKSGRVTVNGELVKPRQRMEGGERIRLDAEAEPVITCDAEDIPIDVVFEDEDILIVNKPAGLVVHPAAGNWGGTLQNGLLFYNPELVNLPRAGLVHRLDKYTSGLLMVAKNLPSHNKLVEQLQAREIVREYLAITRGRMTAGGTVDEPIGRHPIDRKRNAVRETGKPAVSHYRVVERFVRHTLIRVKLETGRTHQIRVHMEFIRYPLVGDPVYGGRFRLPPGINDVLETALQNFRRQALHAAKLGLVHPKTGETMQWEIPIPDDMQELLTALRDNEKEQDVSGR